MSSIPKDIIEINARITELTMSVNAIPKLKKQVLETNEGIVKKAFDTVNHEILLEKLKV